MLHCVAVCCSVLQFVAVWCSVVQCGAVCCTEQLVSRLRRAEVQCVAVCCSVLQCVAQSNLYLGCVVLRCRSANYSSHTEESCHTCVNESCRTDIGGADRCRDESDAGAHGSSDTDESRHTYE